MISTLITPGRQVLGFLVLAIAMTFAPEIVAGEQESELNGKDHKPLSATDFATIMAQYLRNGDDSTVKDAKFLFQECFGGGMLPALKKSLEDKVKWAGGSASSARQPSVGQNNKVPDAGDYWTNALAPELAKPDQQFGDSLKNAANNDAAGPNGPQKPHETPQSEFGGGGETIKMSDGSSHHAIIWTDAKNAKRHDGDIKRVKDALNQAWAGAAAGNTSVTEVSTTDELKAAMEKLKNDGSFNTDEEFFFYATGHGGDGKPIQKKPKKVDGGNSENEELNLDLGELSGISQTDNPNPTLDVLYSDLTFSDPVLLNGTLLGFLDPASTHTLFQLPVSLLGLKNTITIDNTNGDDFTLVEKTFNTGEVNTLVPEPNSLTLMVVSMAVLAAARRRRRQ